MIDFTNMLTSMAGNSPVWMLVSILLLAIGVGAVWLFKAVYKALNDAISKADKIQEDVRRDSQAREEVMREEREFLLNQLNMFNQSLQNLSNLYQDLKEDVREIRNK